MCTRKGRPKTGQSHVFGLSRSAPAIGGSGDGANFSLYEYLARYLPIDEQSYKDGLRVKMEYLMKIAREEFANRLMREL